MRVKERYINEAVPKLKERFGYKTPMQVPTIKKVVLNMGVGEAVQNSKAIEFAEYALSVISGQKPVVTRAKKSIAGFKLREGMPIGCKVTLRRERMYAFLDRLISVALPRVKDFRGLSRKGCDGHGNYSFGIAEQVIFPEVDLDKLDKIRGMNVTICTSAKTDEEAVSLLELIGMPFKKTRS